MREILLLMYMKKMIMKWKCEVDNMNADYEQFAKTVYDALKDTDMDYQFMLRSKESRIKHEDIVSDKRYFIDIVFDNDKTVTMDLQPYYEEYAHGKHLSDVLQSVADYSSTVVNSYRQNDAYIHKDEYTEEAEIDR